MAKKILDHKPKIIYNHYYMTIQAKIWKAHELAPISDIIFQKLIIASLGILCENNSYIAYIWSLYKL